jgi:hypothetical protein
MTRAISECAAVWSKILVESIRFAMAPAMDSGADDVEEVHE